VNIIGLPVFGLDDGAEMRKGEQRGSSGLQNAVGSAAHCYAGKPIN